MLFKVVKEYDGISYNKVSKKGEPRFIRGKNFTFYPSTGEIRYFKETSPEQKKRNAKKRKRSFMNRAYYNFGNSRCLFLTLTYREPEFDLKKVKKDLNLFSRKLNCKYCYVIEQHKSGAYHIHYILKSVNFISNEKIAKMWGHGFTKTVRVKKVIHYLAKYLTKKMINRAFSFSRDCLQTPSFETYIFDIDDIFKKERDRHLAYYCTVYKDNKIVNVSIKFLDYYVEPKIISINLNEFDDILESYFI